MSHIGDEPLNALEKSDDEIAARLSYIPGNGVIQARASGKGETGINGIILLVAVAFLGVALIIAIMR